jgi:hypothetical protein
MAPAVSVALQSIRGGRFFRGSFTIGWRVFVLFGRVSLSFPEEFPLLPVNNNSPHRRQVGSIQPIHLARRCRNHSPDNLRRDAQKFCYPAHGFSSFNRYVSVGAGRHRRRVHPHSRPILNGFG